MYWYVRWDSQIIGHVIAADEKEALTRAEEKFHPAFGTTLAVEPRTGKKRRVRGEETIPG